MVFQNGIPSPSPSTKTSSTASSPGIRTKPCSMRRRRNANRPPSGTRSGPAAPMAMGLSGGQMQRLCIARAVSQNHHVDELARPLPRSPPDRGSHPRAAGITIIIVTHNMQQAARVRLHGIHVSRELIEYGPTEVVHHAGEKGNRGLHYRPVRRTSRESRLSFRYNSYRSR